GVVTYDPATGLFTYTPNAGAGSTSTVDSFTYTIVDGDGDSSTATVNVTLQPDSVPAVVDVTALADDDALAGGNPASTAQDIDANAGDDPLTASEAVFSGKITVDFGNDTGTVSFANLDGTSGTVGTETVDYAWDADSNTLTATGPRGVLFTVAMDADGNYVLTQLDNILHTAGNDEASADDVVLAYRASDSDGDTDETGTLTISFNDDAPTATADTNSLAEGGTVNGNVLTDGSDDAFGADGAVTTSPAGGVIGFAAGSDTSVAAGGTPGSTIESALGFLTLNADGSYSYASKPNSTNADTTDTFVYTIQDADGDISTQTLTISIDNVAGQVSDNDVLVDEAGLDTNGSQGAADSEIDADGQITVTGASGTLTYTLLDPADGTFGTLVLDSATGAYTYTLDTPVTDTTGDDGRNTVSGAVNGAEEFDYQVTDSVGNVIGTGTIVINIKDDVPSVVADDLFGGSLTVDESNLLVDDTGADFTGAFTVTMGADAPGSIAYALTLSAEGADSGLNDTATGADILLYTNGNTVEGRVGGADGAIAFVITNADGVLSLDQRSAVEHPDASNPNDVVDIDDGKIFLTATATDEDNDTASDSLDIGAALNFADDGPSVAITGPTPTLTVDETVLANNAVASFAATFTALFGADGAAAGTQPVYTLGVIAGPSGLVDTASGENVVLSLNGTVVEGRTAIGDALVFTVTVAADGTVTLDQIRAVVHTPDTGPDQATSLSAANLVTLTATATDFDGDTASAVLNIGTSLVFEDDAPSIDVTKGADAGIVLTTQDADTIGGASDTATSTADFGGVFGLTSNAGADGAAAPSLGYALSVTNAVSGLTSNGAAINLYLIGGKVVGSTAANQADVTAGNTVFDLSVSAAGAVTLTQYSQIDHAAEGTTTSPFDDQFAVLADGKVALTASATITDGDGDSDSDSETVDLGGNIRFADDGPSVATTGTAPTLTVDETVLATNASASFAANFTALFGADGAAAGTQPVYTLGVIAGPSGLVDTATGQNVVLSLNGTVVEGRTETGNVLVFTVAVAADGTVTLDQIRAVVHTPDSGPDQATSLSAANLVTLTATATDFDGDTASAVLNIGTSLVFKDDAPVVFNPEDGSVANTDSPPAAFDLNYGTAVGADGLGDVVFSITNGDPAVDSNGNALSFQGSPLFISGNGTNVLTASTAGGVVGFTITIDPDTDQYVVDLAGTISNGGEFSISNLTSAAAGNTEFRVVGSDNPTNNSDNIDIILSGRSSDGTRGTVNTNATSVGIDNQSTNPGEAVRIDFVNNATSGGLGTTGFDYDGHQDVLRFEQVIAQTGGNANTRVEINVTAILADDDQDFSFNGTTPEAGEFFIDITEVQVTDQNGGPGGSQIVHTFSLSDGPIQTKGAITVTFDANGSVNIDGLQVNDLYQVSSDEVFSAILVESPLGNNNFDLGIFDITTQNSADPIDVAFDIVGTDADGDSVTVPDGIQVTFAPVVAPIVLDLDRDGAEFLDLSAGVVYDYGSGAVATAWVGADDGLLARQTATGHDIVFADDAAGAKTDLEGLALAYDSNGDSKLDANDAAFAEFGVWQDADSDGVVDAGEFRSLTDAGITSINLTSDGIAYSAANGDVLVHGTGSYTKADGTTGVLADAGFATAAIAEMNQRGAQVASVNAAIAALVMPEMLMATDQETSGLSSKVLDLGTENPVSGSAQSTMAMADQMAVAGDDFFQSGNDAQASVSSPSIGQTGFENVSQGELGEPAAFDHAGLDLAASAGPAFSFGAVAGAAAFAAPSVEGVHMMDALLALGQDSAAKAQAVATESAEIAALDLSALQEAFADVVDSHAVDAIVDHFAGAALGEAQPESHFDAAILDVGIANPQMFFGMQSMVDMTADDMSALAASA
ncbi:DUF5801 repeats-in-toxin domain-containing protein, partial [Allopontixanthobacter sp.]|uniref:DUF5801 repeats-in-toxin domain-containing protein n=1 Tax=Allopontixanthobacter sp. TaxID=2906452 RepID=UPI002AB9C04C